MWEDLPPYLGIVEDQFFMDERRILASHQRCKKLSVEEKIDKVKNLNDEELSHFLHSNARVISHSHRMLEDIHRTLFDRRCLFILTDGQMRILTLFSVPEVLYACDRRGILPSASLHEEMCGTNAIDLALRYGQLAIIKGAQHFCRLFHNWHSVAVPIIGISGKPLACIDLSCSHESGLHEKIAVTKLIAEKLTAVFESGEDKPDSSLSMRQLSVVSLLTQGLTYKEIAISLKISPRTVESHLEKLRKKFKANTTAQLIAMTVNGQALTAERHKTKLTPLDDA